MFNLLRCCFGGNQQVRNQNNVGEHNNLQPTKNSNMAQQGVPPRGVVPNDGAPPGPRINHAQAPANNPLANINNNFALTNKEGKNDCWFSAARSVVGDANIGNITKWQDLVHRGSKLSNDQFQEFYVQDADLKEVSDNDFKTDGQIDKNKLHQLLQNNGPLVCGGGHAFVITGYDANTDKFIIQNPVAPYGDLVGSKAEIKEAVERFGTAADKDELRGLLANEPNFNFKTRQQADHFQDFINAFSANLQVSFDEFTGRASFTAIDRIYHQ